jgi:hypothetical protein
MPVLALLALVMLTGMGDLGGVPAGTVPKTEENIKVQLVDRSGVSTELSSFSMDGQTFLDGRRGDGQMNISFRELREISFGKVSGEEVPVELLLKSGNRIQLTVRKRTLFYGDTGYGAFRIPARDISRIVMVD